MRTRDHLFVSILSLCLSASSLTPAALAAEPSETGNAAKMESAGTVENAAVSATSPQAPAVQTMKRPRVALALGGGGTRGAAHVGVLKVLTEAGIPIDCIVGTSMGAIVGGLYSAGVPLDDLMTRFEDGRLMKTFMTVPLSVRVVVAPIMVLPRAFGHHPYDGLYKGNKFRKYLNNSVSEYERKIEELKIPFRAVVLNLVDGKPYALSEGNLGYALQASSAVPGLRKPVQIGDNLYVDGGVVANVPVSFAKELNPDIIIAVDVDERFDKVPLKTFTKIGSVSERVVTLQLANIDKQQCKDADILIHPNVDGIGLISTSKKEARQALEAGQKAAQEALPAIKAKLAEFGITAAVPSANETK